MMRTIALLGAAVSVTACATGTTALDLNFDDGIAKAGVVSEVEPKVFYIASVEDERAAEEQDRIGDKRNGYGMVMGAVTTEKPVVDIIRETLSKTLIANGHSVVESSTDGAIQLDADVNRFWFDYKTGLVTVEFFGDVKIDMTLTDGSAEVIFDDGFEGYYSDKTGGGLSKTWTRVMASTLDDLSQEISLSVELMDALMSSSEPATDAVAQQEATEEAVAEAAS